MSAATAGVPAASTYDEPRWHYRRSLASRVILMTTMAVCFAVALVSLGAYVTVKMSLESSLDRSLLQRADKAAQSLNFTELEEKTVPSWETGAADVRVFVVRRDNYAYSMDTTASEVPIGAARGGRGTR